MLLTTVWTMMAQYILKPEFAKGNVANFINQFLEIRFFLVDDLLGYFLFQLVLQF